MRSHRSPGRTGMQWVLSGGLVSVFNCQGYDQGKGRHGRMDLVFLAHVACHEVITRSGLGPQLGAPRGETSPKRRCSPDYMIGTFVFSSFGSTDFQFQHRGLLVLRRCWVWVALPSLLGVLQADEESLRCFPQKMGADFQLQYKRTVTAHTGRLGSHCKGRSIAKNLVPLLRAAAKPREPARAS
ncbi:hypothetical protein B0T11DRAFT_288460 [Plectosphaerella cucumerina]|uniref:Uncharacterized protein n=1 Tax=Plectosphaerella cucumerina TaxID=40658 RepID=A0A8K0X0S5_9PEZI|nr:hypothetical protein B0T11DRAFT_288460 [Plectosphaerella cucumerina]